MPVLQYVTLEEILSHKCHTQVGLIHSGYGVMSIYSKLNEAEMKEVHYVFIERLILPLKLDPSVMILNCQTFSMLEHTYACTHQTMETVSCSNENCRVGRFSSEFMLKPMNLDI